VHWSWTHINDADKQAVIRLMSCGLSVAQAAARVGRTSTSVYNWIQGDVDFAAAINALMSERDDEAEQFRLRVRRSAETMLDHLMDLAEPVVAQPMPDGTMRVTGNPNTRERNAAIKTFFADVHNPILAPKAAAPMAPSIFVNAQQAALLFAAPAATQRGNGGVPRSEGDRPGDAPGGNGHSEDVARLAREVPVADAVQTETDPAGGGSFGANAGNVGEAAGTSVGGG